MAVDSGLRLTSRSNPLLKAVRKAARRSRATDDGLWLAESPHLLEEAVSSGIEVAAIFLADQAPEHVRKVAESCSGQLRLLSDELFADIATTEHSQGALALVRPRSWTVDQIFEGPGPVVVLDGVSDPGNVGAIARSAEAFGAAGLILMHGSAHPDNPKTLRASAGALFRIPVIGRIRAEGLLQNCQAAGRSLLAASAREGRSIREVSFANAVVMVGSEAHGVSAELAEAAEAVHIPTARVESLNAAIAASIILYQSSCASLAD